MDRNQTFLRKAIFCILVLVIFGTSTVLSASTTDWSQPENISGWQADVGLYTYLGMSEDGRDVVYWTKLNPPSQWSLWSRIRTQSGNWDEQPQNVSGWQEALETTPGTYIPLYDLGMTPGGDAWAMWGEPNIQEPGDNIWIKTAQRAAGETEWQVEKVSDWGESYIQDLDFAIGPQGHMSAAWVACTSSPNDGGSCAVYVKRRSPSSQVWGPLERLDGSSGMAIWHIDAVIGPGGLTYVQWIETSPTEADKSGLFGRTWGSLWGSWDGDSFTPLSDWYEDLFRSQPVMGPEGNVTIAWQGIASGTKDAIFSRTRSATSALWSPTEKIGQDMKDSAIIGLAAGEDGTVLAVFIKEDPNASNIYAVMANVRDAVTGWGTEAMISDWHYKWMTYKSIGVLPDGSCVVVWGGQDKSKGINDDEAVFWNTRPPKGSWAGQGRLSPWVANLDFPFLAMGQDGSAIASWTMRDAYQPVLEQSAVMATHYVSGGTWSDAIPISGWGGYMLLLDNGVVVHPDGQPIGAAWYQFDSDKNLSAIMYSYYPLGGGDRFVVYLPMVVGKNMEEVLER